MNILILHNYYRFRGGEDIVFEYESEEFKKLGNNVVIFTKNNNEIDKYNFIQKILFFFHCFYNYNTIKELKKIIKQNPVDVVHVHNVFPLISPAIYNFFSKNKIKIVQTIHNYRFLCPNGLFFTKNKICTKCKNGNYFHCIINKCYKNSFLFSALYSMILFVYNKTFKTKIDKYIVLNEFVKKIFIENGFDEKKIFVKVNPMKDYGVTRDKDLNYFLFLGRISYEKGIDFLLESFTKLKNYNLVIAGTGENLDYYKKKYENNNIKFVGFVDKEKKIELLKKSTALILPSIWLENNPVSVIEAFCLGIPVVASDNGGLPYLIEHNKNGLLFKSEDFDSLKNTLKLFEQNKNLREYLGENARKKFLEEMEISKNIKKLIEIYRS